jgi:hypothetical protein
MPERRPTRAGLRLRSRLSRALAEERGSFLIEIVVSAALIGIVTIAVFASFDGANAASGRNKAKTVGNSLAERDQERLRALPVSALGNVNETNTKTLDKVQYTIVSRGQWITESTGANVSCTGGSQADYVKITSTVTWPNMRQAKPVTQTSIVSPGPGTGVLGVLAKQRDGATPLQGLPVSVSGPESVNATTDSTGCAFMGSLGTGNYTIGAQLSGYTTTGWGVSASDGITPTGTAISDTFMPTAGATTVKTYLYDKAATVNVTFDTKLWDGTIQSQQADHVIFENPNAGLTGVVLLGRTGTQRSTYSPSNVFPFADPYSVYSGDCKDNNPVKYGAPAQSVQADPAGTYNIAAREPAMNILVRRAGLPLGNANVEIAPNSAMNGCATSFTFRTATSPVSSIGELANPAIPYGVWDVCADDGNRRRTITVSNTNPDGLPAPVGVPTTVLDIPISGTRSTC